LKNKEKRFGLNNWWKQFLTGVMGTAIGVGLTFAVSNWVDNHKKDQAQRQTAMMAVYDIDEIVRLMKEDSQEEDLIFPILSHLAAHPEKLDIISPDTLRMVVLYLIDDSANEPRWINDSKEKAFSSGMEAWQNLENSQFYDNVQECYRLRSELYRTIEKDAVFLRPISYERINQYIGEVDSDELDPGGSFSAKGLRRILRETIKTPATTRYLRMYPLRSSFFSRYIDEINRLNKENKFLMSITDEEMSSYIRKNIQKTQPASPKLLAGTWENQMNDVTLIYLFRTDQSVDITISRTDRMSLTVDDMDVQLRVPYSYRMSGTWALDRDSLRISASPSTAEILSLEMDLSNLPQSFGIDNRDSLEVYKREFQENLLQSIRAYPFAQTCEVTLDLTGERLFINIPYTTTLGQTENIRQQFVRK
jgi:hypothetical protein